MSRKRCTKPHSPTTFHWRRIGSLCQRLVRAFLALESRLHERGGGTNLVFKDRMVSIFRLMLSQKPPVKLAELGVLPLLTMLSFATLELLRLLRKVQE